ncbi:protein PYRICULARIA ORYZAE RESISTANCE 21-like [Mangifera indica]|uniref:protein PYRICULARIA ORYZAE RESISTANCE 21-like n=1 Tax=Mangifera indica TaxID=29780 RepID=UPI001CF961B0|nr:protein PYRICULARIA ORYZAE RESISTANCE 21-like [Mangifera indica]XP_044481036.1 protein PYRICULARIA ORYZAE RESISTANCE 21-like [Mangifera indica]
MGEKKVTTMVLTVNLQCEKCYRKVKKVLCSFPQIQDQVYDEKQKTVTIKVVCCSPEKIKQKICCKGGESIENIKIVPPAKPKPKVVIKDPPKPQPAKATEAAPPTPKALVVAPIPQAPVPAPGHPFGMYCNEYHGGPFQRLGYERLVSYDGYCGRPVYDSWGGSGGGWSRGDYFSEENPSTCSIM